MSRHYKTAPCWVIRDSDGNPDSDEWDAHHTNEAEALDGIRQIHEDHEEDQTPEEFAASVAVRRGAEAGELALRMDRAAVERRKSLRPVVLDGPCYSIACDGGGPNCWEEPGSGAEGNLHFGPGDEFDPAAWDFREVSGKHYCGDCQVPEVTA